MNLKPYPKYKDSGIEWLGEIPEGWEVKRLKYIAEDKKFSIVDGPFGTQLKAEEYQDEGVPLIRINNLSYEGKIDDKDIVYISETKAKELRRSSIKKQDVVIGKTGATIGKSGINDKFNHAIIASSCLKISPNKNKLSPNFLNYFMISYNFQDSVLLTAGGSTRDTINISPFSNLYTLLPSYSEQQSIANFLDQKTAKIDDLIKKNEKLIELLEEKRQAIISRAVTKGLDPNAKMKDSGIERIGEIPEGWEMKKIKYTSYIKGRVGWHGLRSDEFTDEGTYLVTGTDFIGDKVNWETCYHISDERYNQDPYIQLRENDLLITKDGTIGKVALVKNLPDRATLNSGIMLIRQITKDYCTDFMFWILNSKVFSEYNEYTKTGSTIQHLYQETFENFIFSVPHVDEQKNICAYLTQKTTYIDEAIKKIQTQIATLKEYRQALISNVVTGKVRIDEN